MQLTRRGRILRVVCNVFLYFCVVTLFVALNRSIEPTFRGFFCDDQTIAYPYRSDTVRGWHLGVGAVLVVPVVLIVVELIARSLPSTRHSSGTPTGASNGEVPFSAAPATVGGAKRFSAVGLSFGYVYGMYLFGMAATLLVTEVGKQTIGRLRPHFFAVCRPDFAALNCSSGYVDTYTCASDADPAMIKEARKSFPSGHAATAVFAAVFLAVYFRRRMNTFDGALLVRLLVDVILFSLAFFTSLSRVIDNKHHWSDVLAGAVLGTIGAVWTVLSMPRHSTWHDGLVRPIRTRVIDIEQPINTEDYAYGDDSETWKM